MNYKACIFDLDGTLTDTLESLTLSVNETMKEIGFPRITQDQCRQFAGDGARVLIEKTLRAVGDEKLSRFDEAFAVYRRIFEANCTYHVAPYKGVPELLQILRDKGMKLGVLSNKPDRQAVHVVETVFGRNVFDTVRGQRDGVPRKPDPTAALAIAEEFGSAPEETLYIGDSEVDAETGAAAGMRVVLVSWGFRPAEVLEHAGEGARIADSVEEILEIIDERRKIHE